MIVACMDLLVAKEAQAVLTLYGLSEGIQYTVKGPHGGDSSVQILLSGEIPDGLRSELEAIPGVSVTE